MHGIVLFLKGHRGLHYSGAGLEWPHISVTQTDGTSMLIKCTGKPLSHRSSVNPAPNKSKRQMTSARYLSRNSTTFFRGGNRASILITSPSPTQCSMDLKTFLFHPWNSSYPYTVVTAFCQFSASSNLLFAKVPPGTNSLKTKLEAFPHSGALPGSISH